MTDNKSLCEDGILIVALLSANTSVDVCSVAQEEGVIVLIVFE
jgi:hypothetical protein